MSTTVSIRSNRCSFKTGAKSSGTAASDTFGTLRPRRSSQRTAAGTPAGGRSAAVSPVATMSSRRTTPRSSLSSWARRSDGSSSDRRSVIVSTPSRSCANASSRLSRATSRPWAQTSSRAKSSVSRSTGMEPGSPSSRRTSRVNSVSAPRRAAPSASNKLRCTRSRLAAESRSSRLASTVRSVGSSPRPFFSSRDSSRSTPSRLTWAPRCMAATSSR